MLTTTTPVSVAAPLRKQVEEILRQAIISGRLQPGKHLVDRELCEELEVSRTVIREAQRSLEAEGLVVIYPNRGCFVRAISAEQARQIYEVRAVLEPLAAQAFAERASDDEVARLRSIYDEFRRATRKPDPIVLTEIKARFYRHLLRGSRNEFAEKMMGQILNHISQYRATSMSQPGRLARTTREILLIVEAIERRDPQAAWEACQHHVEEASRETLRALNRAAIKDDDLRQRAPHPLHV